MAKRIKHVFSGYSDVAHLWAHQAQDYAKNSGGCFYFTGDTIYSYGSHFPIARIVKRRGVTTVLFTYRTYSSSTSRHTREVASACSHLPKIYCYNPKSNFSKQDLREWEAQLKEQANKLARARKPELYVGSILRIQETAKAYCKFFGKRAPALFSKAPGDIANVLKKQSDAEKAKQERLVREGAKLADAFFERERVGTTGELLEKERKALNAWSKTTEGAERVRKFREEQRAERVRKYEPTAAKILKIWKRYGNDAKEKAIGNLEREERAGYYDYQNAHSNAAHLRFDRKTNEVVTSKNYKIPRDAALRFYHSIQKQGKALIGTKFMEFNIDGLNGSLRIGCHSIPMSEVLEMGAFLESHS